MPPSFFGPLLFSPPPLFLVPPKRQTSPIFPRKKGHVGTIYCVLFLVVDIVILILHMFLLFLFLFCYRFLVLLLLVLLLLFILLVFVLSAMPTTSLPSAEALCLARCLGPFSGQHREQLLGHTSCLALSASLCVAATHPAPPWRCCPSVSQELLLQAPWREWLLQRHALQLDVTMFLECDSRFERRQTTFARLQGWRNILHVFRHEKGTQT